MVIVGMQAAAAIGQTWFGRALPGPRPNRARPPERHGAARMLLACGLPGPGPNCLTRCAARKSLRGRWAGSTRYDALDLRFPGVTGCVATRRLRRPRHRRRHRRRRHTRQIWHGPGRAVVLTCPSERSCAWCECGGPAAGRSEAWRCEVSRSASSDEESRSSSPDSRCAWCSCSLRDSTSDWRSWSLRCSRSCRCNRPGVLGLAWRLLFVLIVLVRRVIRPGVVGLVRLSPIPGFARHGTSLLDTCAAYCHQNGQV